MEYRFKEYRAEYFEAGPEIHNQNNLRLEYLSFCRPENEGKPPVIFLGNSFLERKYLRPFVRGMIDAHPIILLDLPGLGSNREAPADDMSPEAQAALLLSFHYEKEITKSIPIAHSYAALIAYQFAGIHPERVEKLVLIAPCLQLRPTLKMVGMRSMRCMRLGNHIEFQQMTLAYLHNQVETPPGKRVANFLRIYSEYLSSLNENESEKERVLGAYLAFIEGGRISGKPSCETLILVGEYDHFVTPHESYLLAQQIERHTYVKMRNADHLSLLEVPILLRRLCLLFLEDKLEKRIPGVAGFEKSDSNSTYAPAERRMNPRRKLSSPVRLFGPQGEPYSGIMRNVNQDGCFVEVVLPAELSLQGGDDFQIELPGFDKAIDILPLRGDGGIHCVFIRNNAEVTRQLGEFIHTRLEEREELRMRELDVKN